MDETTLAAWVETVETLAWDEAPAEQGSERLSSLGPEQVKELLARVPSDETLALLIRRGTLAKEAFEELFVRRSGALLLRWFWRWSRDRDQAADLTQRLMCRFLENHLASFDPAGNFRAYLWRAAHNLFVDTVRRESRQRSLDSIDEPPAPETPPLDPDLLDRLETAVERLPALERSILKGTLAGQPAESLACDLNLPRRRVYALLYQARRRLEQELNLTPDRPKNRTAHSQRTRQGANS
jgi:RNA polymerase sigma factor (sigma-70 family)